MQQVKTYITIYRKAIYYLTVLAYIVLTVVGKVRDYGKGNG